MSIIINVNGINKSLEELLEIALEAKKLPKCFGNMCPPLLKNFIILEGTEIFKIKFNVPEEEQVKADLKILTDSTEFHTRGKFVLTTEGEKIIEEEKLKMVDEFVTHVLTCIECKVQDSCFKLTTGYLMTTAMNNKE